MVHVLLSTPEEMISPWEEYRDYSLIPAKFRIKEFDFDYDPDFIEKAQERVLQCREFVKELLENL